MRTFLMKLVLATMALASTTACQTTNINEPTAQTIKIGVIADPQYADRPDGSVRFYRQSPAKLAEAVSVLNNSDVDLVFNLGDLIDKDWESFDTLLAITSKLEPPLVNVLGNHDFSVSDSYKSRVPTKLGLEERYYRLDDKGWRFLILDGNDLSLYAWPEGSENARNSKQAHEELYPDAPSWNGGIGPEQMSWLKSELEQADEVGKPVILMSHFPVYPEDKHNLWNAEEVLSLISEHDSVKAWFNGHNHVGNYGFKNGIHFVTFKGMVDTSESAFALVTLTQDIIEIDGFGREPDRHLKLNQE